jgi:hypothetical protein
MTTTERAVRNRRRHAARRARLATGLGTLAGTLALVATLDMTARTKTAAMLPLSSATAPAVTSPTVAQPRVRARPQNVPAPIPVPAPSMTSPALAPVVPATPAPAAIRTRGS